MGIGERIKDFIAPEEDDDQLELNEDEAVAVSPYEKGTLQSSSAITANVSAE